MYSILKHIHLTAIVISLTLFTLRFIWTLRGSDLMQKKWVKIVPHVNDTILLASALALCFVIGSYPFSDSWLTQKVVGVVCYILLGLWALKWAKTNGARWIGFIGAIGFVVLTAKIAVFKQPLLIL